MLTIHNAHSDNVKKASYLANNNQDGYFVMSGSADRTVKLWDLRNTAAPLDSVKLPHAVEDFCPISVLPSSDSQNHYLVANGPMITVLGLTEQRTFSRLADYQAF